MHGRCAAASGYRTLISTAAPRLARRPAAECYRCPRRASSSQSSADQKNEAKAVQFDPVIFSGIQPTGTPHLGNFLGFFLPYLELQRSSPATTPLFLSIVGLHAITLPQKSEQLRQDRRNMLAALLACGVDPKRTCLYFQEDVPEHAELAWYLNTLAPVGLLRRMTTWKSRIAVSRNANSEDEVSEADLRLGLLSYPVLQAADVMLYKSTIVPVGEDQAQHLELSRTLAETFNRTFSPSSPIFPLPETRIVPSKRILSLRDPSAKMSKSAPNPLSRIGITDTPAQISKKIRGAVTDPHKVITYDPVKRPGVSNLLIILQALDKEGRSLEELTDRAQREEWGMSRLKDEVAGVVIERIEPVRKEYERIQADMGFLREVAKSGRETAREVAARTMDQVRGVVGLSRI